MTQHHKDVSSPEVNLYILIKLPTSIKRSTKLFAFYGASQEDTEVHMQRPSARIVKTTLQKETLEPAESGGDCPARRETYGKAFQN